MFSVKVKGKIFVCTYYVGLYRTKQKLIYTKISCTYFLKCK